ncbi:hypothetical protein PAXINDRAFT_18494 [Paxillus involutus ATCC 200175]|uniref:SAP domain-containing protein n=1 Tax=Paxillus involutus ATCC 200175 TaxID=664439 RepID=A0A0C9SNR6_PAXIN|nr:hypothetical protein PAXINDRAFT_18494 [Paxillus involutus ATCC 200175]
MEESGEGISWKNLIKEYMAARAESFKEETILKAWRKSGINPLNPDIFTKEDYAPSYSTSTNLHLPEMFPSVGSSLDNLLSDDSTYEPENDGNLSETLESDSQSSSSSEEDVDLEGFNWEAYAMDLEQEAGEGVSQEWHPDQLEYTQSASPLPCQPGPSHFPSSFQQLEHTPSASAPAPQGPRSLSHHKTRSASRALSRSATLLVTPHDQLKSAAERLREAEDKVCELEEENELLKNVNGAAETHCYFAGKMVAHLQRKLNSKETDKGKRHRAPPPVPSAFQPPPLQSKPLSVESALTHVSLAAEPVHPYTTPALRPSGSVHVHPNTLEELKKQKEAEVKVKKAAEEQARRERRADHSRLFTGTLNKTKKKDELEDLVAALALPEAGKKDDLLDKIIGHFNKFPQLKGDQ